MKVCIVHHKFRLGGISRVAIEIANGLANLEGTEVTLVSSSEEEGETKSFFEINKKVSTITNYNKRKFIEKARGRLYRYRIKITKEPFKISKCFQSEINDLAEIIESNNFDCVILCTGELTAALPTLKNKLPNIKFIAWQHFSYDILTEKHHSNHHDYFEGLEKADAIVCLTKKDEELFKKHNINTRCIYNPLTIKNKKISELKGKTIVFTGRLEIEPKGIDYLLEVVEMTPDDWQFVIAGEGKDREQIEEIIKHKGISSKVKLVGALEGKCLINHYVEGTLFVSTSRFEGFPLVIAEAMSCGLPIVAFLNHGSSEVLSDGEYGILVEQGNVKQFYNGVNRLMNDKNLRDYYQKKGIERANELKLQNIIPKWVELLEDGV